MGFISSSNDSIKVWLRAYALQAINANIRGCLMLTTYYLSPTHGIRQVATCQGNHGDRWRQAIFTRKSPCHFRQPWIREGNQSHKVLVYVHKCVQSPLSCPSFPSNFDPCMLVHTMHPSECASTTIMYMHRLRVLGLLMRVMLFIDCVRFIYSSS